MAPSNTPDALFRSFYHAPSTKSRGTVLAGRVSGVFVRSLCGKEEEVVFVPVPEGWLSGAGVRGVAEVFVSR